MKWVLRLLLAVAAVYVVLFGVVLLAMLRPPQQFGLLMKRMPQVVIWALLPTRQMWLWARKGVLEEGQPAPDFSLSTHDQSGRVTLSAHRGRPVVLVFGSYT
jgi:hypothetical protein